MILAAGASGRLRPVIDELLARGHEVRVTARDPQAPAARELGIAHTILAPVYFMQNAFNPSNAAALAARRFPLAGERAAAILARLTGRAFAFQQVDRDVLPDGMRLLFDWLDRAGPQVDVPALRRRFPDVRWHTFERWAAGREWLRRAPAPGGSSWAA
jgi:hypothetical protein